MTDLWRISLSIFVIGLVTLFTRVLPFLFFRSNKPPSVVVFLEMYLPPAVMVILVIYSVRNINWISFPHGIPELLSIALTVVLHLWKRNPLISILGGTVCYMVLVQSDIIGNLFK